MRLSVYLFFSRTLIGCFFLLTVCAFGRLQAEGKTRDAVEPVKLRTGLHTIYVLAVCAREGASLAVAATAAD